MSWLILVLVWLVISVATATRGFSGGGVECYSVLVLYYCIMSTFDFDILFHAVSSYREQGGNLLFDFVFDEEGSSGVSVGNDFFEFSFDNSGGELTITFRRETFLYMPMVLKEAIDSLGTFCDDEHCIYFARKSKDDSMTRVLVCY